MLTARPQEALALRTTGTGGQSASGTLSCCALAPERFASSTRHATDITLSACGRTFAGWLVSRWQADRRTFQFFTHARVVPSIQHLLSFLVRFEIPMIALPWIDIA